MLWIYIGECAKRSWRTAWDSANNLAGTVIGVGLGLVFPVNWWDANTAGGKAADGIVSVVMYTLVAWLTLLLIRTVFVAPYSIWKAQKSENSSFREMIRPKLKCSFSASDPGCVKRDVRIGERNGTELRGDFYRVKVETDGVKQVNSCSGRLRSIKHDGIEVFSGQPCRLPFTPSERADAVNKTIHAGEPEYLDCVLVTNDNKVFIWASDQDGIRDAKYGNLFGATGSYKLNVSIISDTPLATISLVFKWSGSRQNAEMICHAEKI